MSKAVVLTGYGPSSVLKWQDVEPPEPGPDEIRLKPELERGVLDRFPPMFVNGDLHLRPRSALPVTDAATAHDLIEAGVHEKLVLVIDN